jgi:protein-L-isoaspartate(D-aspartate) O-methyltransferase
LKQRPKFPVQLDDIKSSTPSPKKPLLGGVQGVGTQRSVDRAVSEPTHSGAVGTAQTDRANAKRQDLKHSSQLKPSVSLSAAGFAHPSGLGLDSLAVREHMVKKLAQQGILDEWVLQAMRLVERHQFVDTALVNQAYEDTSLPIGFGQTISKPSVVARMIELLRGAKCLDSNGSLGRVLEIGTGCGYQAAVLSRVAQEVYSIERVKGLYEKARNHIRPLLIPNLHLLFADGMLGYERGAPYAGIIAAAGGDNIPAQWLDQLAVGGRIVAPVSTGQSAQALVVIDRTASGFERVLLEPVHFVPLKSGVV